MVQSTQIGERLKALRAAAGMSQQALAVAAGLSTSIVSQIEQGQKEDPRISTIQALAQALGVSVDELLKSSHPPAAGEPAAKKSTKKK
jgi:transcriptional regulator with XRE-family HTH domain